MLKHAAIVAAILAIFAALARNTAGYGPYCYDEADYMYAAERGMAPNWIDSPTNSLPALIRVGLDRPRDQGQGQRAELSEWIRGTDDILFYRHWHGPIYISWLELTRPFASEERTVRAAGDIFPLLTAIAMYFGALSLLPRAAGSVAAILAAALFLWSFPVVRTTELAPHQLFALSTTLTLICLAKIWQDSRSPRAWWYAAVAFAAADVCILEVGLAMAATALVCGYLARKRLNADWALAARSIALLIAVITAIWPAAIFKLSLLKSYLFMAYLALFRHGAWGSDIGLGETWRLRIASSPVPWIVFAVAAVCFMRRRRAPVLIPSATFTVLMFLAISRVNTDVPRYVLPLWPGIVLFGALGAAILVEKWRAPAQSAIALLICAAMFLTSWPNIRRNLPRPNRRAEAILAIVAPLAPSHPVLLVPHDDMPMLHYYFPGVRVKTYYTADEIPSLIHAQPVDGVVSPGDAPRLVGTKEAAAGSALH